MITLRIKTEMKILTISTSQYQKPNLKQYKYQRI